MRRETYIKISVHCIWEGTIAVVPLFNWLGTCFQLIFDRPYCFLWTERATTLCLMLLTSATVITTEKNNKEQEELQLFVLLALFSWPVDMQLWGSFWANICDYRTCQIVFVMKNQRGNVDFRDLCCLRLIDAAAFDTLNALYIYC